MDGVLVADKPAGITSHDVVHRVRRLTGVRRVGHLGTLDPIATGVLPLVIGKATRLASLLAGGDKVYQAVIALGVVTDTYDTTGAVVSMPGARRATAPDAAEIEQATRRFVGTFHQTPPPYSAKKIRGVRAYRLARQHRPVDPEPVEVTVHALEITHLDSSRIACRITCAPGFYMRSLAHDLGAALAVGGCLTELRRLRSGAFGESEAVPLAALETAPELAAERLIGLNCLLPEVTGVVVTTRGRQRVAHGHPIATTDIETWMPGRGAAARRPASHVKIYDQVGRLLAIAEETAPEVLRPRIVLV